MVYKKSKNCFIKTNNTFSDLDRLDTNKNKIF